MIKTVIFDVDGVLIDSFEANYKFYCDLFSKYNYQIPTRDEYSQVFHKTMRDTIKILSKSPSVEEVDKMYNIAMGLELEYDDSLISIPQGAEEVLEFLSKDYNLAIVTSRDRDFVFEGPTKYKELLKRIFKVVVALEDTIEHKPSPEPILLAIKKLNSNSNECVYIGDTESDMEAARAAGVKFINYGKVPFQKADASTSLFNKLPDLIKKL